VEETTMGEGRVMKWGEFKNKVEQAGVKDEDEIWYIDMAFDDRFTVSKKDNNLGWAVSG
jgi:hypothetical protein